ncbi:hypothetical protein E8E11_008384 [Didymella keratinophila]|nr:hypothetical protein E8E11_008384 [Didymella keratinophila]
MRPATRELVRNLTEEHGAIINEKLVAALVLNEILKKASLKEKGDEAVRTYMTGTNENLEAKKALNGTSEQRTEALESMLNSSLKVMSLWLE